MSEKIGFIGLGIMGSGMVDNLMGAGFERTNSIGKRHSARHIGR